MTSGTAASPTRRPAIKSAAFHRFDRAQRQVNAFLWSSEFAYELVCQKLLTNELRQTQHGVNTIFADVTCHAFIASARTQRQIDAGQTPRFATKYRAGIKEFETDLRNNLEQVCRHVIVRFYSALEHFLTERTTPFLRLDELPPKEQRARTKQFLATPFQRLEAYLRGEPANLTLRTALPRKTALLAQTFRHLRNHLVHKETEEDWQPPWTDQEFQGAILADGTLGPEANGKLVKTFLFEAVGRQVGAQHKVPPLFFYALFSLTDLRKFAEAVEAALPPASPPRFPAA